MHWFNDSLRIGITPRVDEPLRTLCTTQVVDDLQGTGNEEWKTDVALGINPTNRGAIEAPTVRATPVMPAAADRSSGSTTAMV